MAVTIKSLIRGQLANNTLTPVYSPPASRAAIVKNIRLVNTSTTATIKVNAKLKRAVTSQADVIARIGPVDLLLAPGQMYVDDSEVTLENFIAAGITTTDTIQLQSDNATGQIDYVLSGVERAQTAA